jgi:hypothetical protein
MGWQYRRAKTVGEVVSCFFCQDVRQVFCFVYSYRVATDLAEVIACCFFGGVAQGDSGLDVVGSGGVAVVVGHFWCALCYIFY